MLLIYLTCLKCLNVQMFYVLFSETRPYQCNNTLQWFNYRRYNIILPIVLPFRAIVSSLRTNDYDRSRRTGRKPQTSD